MINSPGMVPPAVMQENRLSISSVLKDSYNNTIKNIQDGMGFFKDEFSALRDNTETCINLMMLPINNFLKDISQIDAELQRETTTFPTQLSSPGPVVPLEVALEVPMEENY